MDLNDKIPLGILFIHGIVGNSKIFNFLTPYVDENCEAVYVTLAGHGGNALDFSKTSMDEWKEQIRREVETLRRRCVRIMVVAHSMGCLFAITEALKGRVDSIILINPPLAVSLTRDFFRNILKVGFGRISDDKYAAAAKDAYGVSIDYNPLHYYGWPKRYVELFSEIKRVGKLLLRDNIPVETKVYLSFWDEMVSVGTIKYFINQPKARISFLATSSHYYFSEIDELKVTDQFVEEQNKLCK